MSLPAVAAMRLQLIIGGPFDGCRQHLPKLSSTPNSSAEAAEVQGGARMASNRGNQGGSQGGNQRGFAGMDDNRQREIASQGGKASARVQARDADGQFAGRSDQGGSGKGQSSSGGRGGSSSRKQGGSSGRQGGSSREAHRRGRPSLTLPAPLLR